MQAAFLFAIALGIYGVVVASLAYTMYGRLTHGDRSCGVGALVFGSAWFWLVDPLMPVLAALLAGMAAGTFRRGPVIW